MLHRWLSNPRTAQVPVVARQYAASTPARAGARELTARRGRGSTWGTCPTSGGSLSSLGHRSALHDTGDKFGYRLSPITGTQHFADLGGSPRECARQGHGRFQMGTSMRWPGGGKKMDPSSSFRKTARQIEMALVAKPVVNGPGRELRRAPAG